MKIERKKLDQVTDSYHNLSGHTLLTDPSFMNIWKSVDGTPVCWTATSSDGILLAALPGIEFGIKPIARFQAMPDGLYSSFLQHPELDKTTLRNVFDNLKNHLLKAGYTKMFLVDYFKQLPPSYFETEETYKTQLVNIAHPEWEPADKKLLSEIRKATREQTSYVTFDPSKHLDKFLRLMKQTEERHDRKPKYSDTFFEQLAKVSVNDKRILWLWVEQDNNAVTSHIYFQLHDMLLNWQIYYDKSYSYMKANQYILYSVAKEMFEKGVRWLNMGSSPGTAESLKQYKSKWGTVEYSYPCYLNKTFLGKIV